jgi:hypothetical protein
MQSTLDLLINKYGITLSLEQLGEVLKNTPKTLDNKIRLGTLPVPTFREGGRRLAFAQDVAEYLERRRCEITEAFAPGPSPVDECIV